MSAETTLRSIRDMKQKADIPNEQGFRFVIIHQSGKRFPCVVQKNENGSFSAFDIRTRKQIAETAPWAEFSGWEEMPQETPLEAFNKTLSPFAGMRRNAQFLKTKDQVQIHLSSKPPPKKGESLVVANLNRLERITLVPFKSTYGKPLYSVEQWSK